jgi:hypothetical protein
MVGMYSKNQKSVPFKDRMDVDEFFARGPTRVNPS